MWFTNKDNEEREPKRNLLTKPCSIYKGRINHKG